MLDEWPYARPYASETERVAAFQPWLHHYNSTRGHTSLKGQPPASRVTNLRGRCAYVAWMLWGPNNTPVFAKTAARPPSTLPAMKGLTTVAS